MDNGMIGSFLQMLGANQQPQRIPYQNNAAFPMSNVTQAYYQPNMLMSILQPLLMPGIKQIAPPLVMEHDWNRMRRLDAARNAAYSTPAAFSGEALRAVELIGNQFSSGIGTRAAEMMMQMPEHPMLGGLASMAANAMGLGGGLASEHNTVYQNVARYFSGPSFGPRGRMFAGDTGEQSRSITDALARLAYRDSQGPNDIRHSTSLLPRIPGFKMADYDDVMRLGLDYGMKATRNDDGNINIDDLMKKTEGMAKAIDAGMAIYRTFDKEEVLQNVINLTRGALPANNVGEIENALYKFKAMANSMNVSMEFIQQFGEEQAKLLENLGIKGVSAASIGIGSHFMRTRIIDAMSPQDVANMGGQQGVLRAHTMATYAFLGSSAYRQLGAEFSMSDLTGTSKETIAARIARGEKPGADFENIAMEKLREKYRDIGLTGGAIEMAAKGEYEKRAAGGVGALTEYTEQTRGALLSSRDKYLGIESEMISRLKQDPNIVTGLRAKSPEAWESMMAKYLTSVDERLDPQMAREQAKIMANALKIDPKVLEQQQRLQSEEQIRLMSQNADRQPMGIFANFAKKIAGEDKASTLSGVLSAGLYGTVLTGNDPIHGYGVGEKDVAAFKREIEVKRNRYRSYLAGNIRAIGASDLAAIDITSKLGKDNAVDTITALTKAVSGKNAIDVATDINDMDLIESWGRGDSRGGQMPQDVIDEVKSAFHPHEKITLWSLRQRGFNLGAQDAIELIMQMQPDDTVTQALKEYKKIGGSGVVKESMQRMTALRDAEAQLSPGHVAVAENIQEYLSKALITLGDHEKAGQFFKELGFDLSGGTRTGRWSEIKDEIQKGHADNIGRIVSVLRPSSAVTSLLSDKNANLAKSGRAIVDSAWESLGEIGVDKNEILPLMNALAMPEEQKRWTELSKIIDKEKYEKQGNITSVYQLASTIGTAISDPSIGPQDKAEYAKIYEQIAKLAPDTKTQTEVLKDILAWLKQSGVAPDVIKALEDKQRG
jgi:hypothetical protein